MGSPGSDLVPDERHVNPPCFEAFHRLRPRVRVVLHAEERPEHIFSPNHTFVQFARALGSQLQNFPRVVRIAMLRIERVLCHSTFF